MLPVILLYCFNFLRCSCLYFSVVLRREMILIHSFFQTKEQVEYLAHWKKEHGYK